MDIHNLHPYNHNTAPTSGVCLYYEGTCSMQSMTGVKPSACAFFKKGGKCTTNGVMRNREVAHVKVEKNKEN